MKKCILVLILLSAVLPGSAGTLEADFKNPPVSVRPYVWWHWMGPNFSKEGITKDLEAMKAAGIGGATVFNLTSAVQESQAPTENNPWPENTYRSQSYWQALRHAAAEADRLGLELGLHNTVGYSTTGGPWIDEQRGMQKVVWKSVTIDGGKAVSIELPKPDQPHYSGWGSSGQMSVHYEDIGFIAVPQSEAAVAIEQVVDLTSKFKNGRLEWNAPPGKWAVFRFGYAPTGANPHPVPDDVMGKVLEVDKMSAEQNRYHWSQVMDPLKVHLGPYLGKSFRHFLIDSYEAGHQSWTPGFREEFIRRKGYDPLPWMATLVTPLTGDRKGAQQQVIGSEELTDRFAWDYRDVVSTLYFEHGWQVGAEAIHAVGCSLQFEPYSGPFDTIDGAALADLPMGEFWTGGKGGIGGNIVAAGRAAGRTVIGAEAFTGRPEVSQWTETPGFLKLSADGSFASGVNRMILHHWVHQPFNDKYQPGMGMGWWGTHFGRNQTWFEAGKVFFRYLGRVQALLQRGETPCEYVSVGSLQDYSSDAIPWSVFRDGLTMQQGRIVLPSGRRYALLTIPHSGAMLPADVKRVGELLSQGAVIVCDRPARSPSLADYPRCDSQVEQLADTIWGEQTAATRKVGKGRLYGTGDLRAALRDLEITPAFWVTDPSPKDIRIQHRQDGNTDIFFVANVNNHPNTFTVSFRVSGKRPEFWNAETGSITPAGIWRQKDGRTEVQLALDAAKSIFVVFRDGPLPVDHGVGIETADPSNIRILNARFGTDQTNAWTDAAARLRELASGGRLDLQVSLSSLGLGDPAPNIVKTLEVEYEQDGKKHTVVRKEGERLTLGTPLIEETLVVQGLADGGVKLFSQKAVSGCVTFASGRQQPFELPAARIVEVAGTWSVDFKSPVDNPPPLKMTALQSLTECEDASIRYFSGTAAYQNTFTIGEIAPTERVLLDLGKVYDMAEVTVNDTAFGVLWHKPFTVDITAAVKPGKNRLRVAVTNTWHNRLVGDEQHPADFEWGKDRGPSMGRAIKAYPDWFINNQPRPSEGRKAFVIWYYHRPETALLPAGLVGPVQVKIQTGRTVE